MVAGSIAKNKLTVGSLLYGLFALLRSKLPIPRAKDQVVGDFILQRKHYPVRHITVAEKKFYFHKYQGG